jgi:hypothetical protein
MQVIFIVQVFLKCLYGRKELGAVAVVESAVHSAVELLVGLVVRVVNSLCQDRTATEEQYAKRQKKGLYLHF